METTQELKAVTSKLSVLYVEDEVDIRLSVQQYLQKLFKEVETAENGAEGLRMYDASRFDIVITDIQMPVMSGLEMAIQIKAINPHQDIIIVSAYTEPSYFMDAIRLGVDGYIIKPIHFEQMNQTLYKTADKVSKFKENEAYKSNLKKMVKERTEAVLELERDKIENFESTLLALVSMIEDRDTYTGGHSQRVAMYSKMIASEMGLSDETCDLLYRAGILHDIGKVATPDAVLLKPNKLNDLEFKLIQEHVSVGFDLLSKIPMYKEISEIIHYHHERYDGKGYPTGAKAEEIPLPSRIMMVADAFDAMTTNRIYKGRKSIKSAIEELKLFSGKQFHPEVVEAASRVFSLLHTLAVTSQIPKTAIEQERFAYFYRDQITDAYNTDYLDFILIQNSFEVTYTSINILYMHSFTTYNQTYGWSEGNKLLYTFVKRLQALYPDSLIFRIHGDDFVLLDKESVQLDIRVIEEVEIIKNNDLKITHKYINLEDKKITSLIELEALI